MKKEEFIQSLRDKCLAFGWYNGEFVVAGGEIHFGDERIAKLHKSQKGELAPMCITLNK
jgi:hypothetical protein